MKAYMARGADDDKGCAVVFAESATEAKKIAQRTSVCGNCKHWHEWAKEEYPKNWNSELRKGSCDINLNEGYSFEDECYDEEFNCFEEADR